ncbi:lipocalin family protein [Aquimarina sp. 2201CG5-10]|uniref:lipocalin family protein n=1 Tax=Aquimarina callyspongiae TaxID=3098150 RepID=UPI002AB511FA|nr:lipocalin family protein [Aquimarina sp. 2201CG5-10]MDY8137660.1 hypothetical protein [Aquimarina sp. 2201CG5-10]
MNRIKFYIVFILIVSCTKTNPEEYIKHLPGYWEIERVIRPDGSEKKYNFNQSIDFFEVKDSTGIRKKLQPQLNGNFIISGNNESFSLRVENDSLRIYYKNTLDDWKETIISIKENTMTIKNETGNVYFYKRYQKIEL